MKLTRKDLKSLGLEAAGAEADQILQRNVSRCFGADLIEFATNVQIFRGDNSIMLRATYPRGDINAAVYTLKTH